MGLQVDDGLGALVELASCEEVAEGDAGMGLGIVVGGEAGGSSGCVSHGWVWVWVWVGLG